MSGYLRKAVTFAALAVSAGGANAQSMRDVPFACSDGRTITANFSGETAQVTMNMSLDAKPTGSGFLYDGPAGNLRGQGDEIMWKENSDGPVTCLAVPGGAELVGGAWELAQVMPNGADGNTIEADDPARHSLSFLSDGALVLLADCNRGRGTWSAAPEERGRGVLTLGPAAVTRMACVADQFPQMASDLDKAVAYRVEEDTLQIEMQDGAIYRFRAAWR